MCRLLSNYWKMGRNGRQHSLCLSGLFRVFVLVWFGFFAKWVLQKLNKERQYIGKFKNCVFISQ